MKLTALIPFKLPSWLGGGPAPGPSLMSAPTTSSVLDTLNDTIQILDPNPGIPQTVDPTHPMTEATARALIEAVEDITVGGGGGSSNGADNSVPGKGTTSTTASTLAIARSTRQRLLILNPEDTLTLYVGPLGVTVLTGFPIEAGGWIVVTGTKLWQVISASGTPAWNILDEYND